MPYTLSHAIVALPVAVASRGKVPIAALVVGCLSPDFPYVLHLTPTHAPGHSTQGVFIYCLAPALLLLLVWYRWLAKPVSALFHLPYSNPQLSPLFYGLTVLGVLLGAFSHVLWDASSHANGAFVQNSTMMQTTFWSTPLYKWNQYGSGLLGLLGLMAWHIRTIYQHRATPYAGFFWLGTLIYTASIIGFVIIANVIHQSETTMQYVARASLGCIAGAGIASVIYAAVVSRKL